MDRCKLSTFSFIPFESSPFPPNDKVENEAAVVAAVVAAVDGKLRAVEPVVVDTGISC